MPLYDHRCPECESAKEVYAHTAADKSTQTILCECGSSMGPVLSVGIGLTFFESGKPRTLWNLGPEPVTVTSHGQHRQLMRERKLEWTTKWPTQKTGGWV